MAEPQSPTLAGNRSTGQNTSSRTITDTIVGEHTHTIVGYSLIKGIGDGEPIASDRFTVGGHEWVLLFYPDGKRSSSEPHLGDGANGNVINVGQALGQGQQLLLPPGAPAPGAPAAQAPALPAPAPAPQAHAPLFGAAEARGAAEAAPGHGGAAAAPGPGAQAGHAAGGAGPGQALVLHMGAQQQNQQQNQQQQQQQQQVAPAAQRPQRRDTTNEYAALFVALIGEGPNPQGVVNTSEGKVVRAFHRFTLVDQANQQRDLTKGRTREAGAVKISCARQDPNARNCHGYRKFVKRNILEDPNRGFLLNDTIVIKYTIELVVSSGGALSRANAAPTKAELIKVPPPCLGKDLGALLQSGNGSDYTIVVGDENIAVHRVILEARSPFFAGMLGSNMSEAQEGRFVIKDMVLPVVKAVLHFIYTDSLPEEMEGPLLEVPMAQHLLVAADLYQLTRLRRICERRLCETVDVETAATTLALAEQNHAEELKRVCLDFVARNLQAVMGTDGYRHMTRSCPALQAELLSVIAATSGAEARPAHAHRSGHVRVREHNAGDAPDEARRVRQRREP